MKRKIYILIFISIILVFLSIACSSKNIIVKNDTPSYTKKIALTIDDLPFADNLNILTKNEQKKFFNKILEILTKHHIHATCFVIGKNLTKEWYGLIKELLKRGNSLGNHTYSHIDLNKFSAKYYINNIRKCNNRIVSALKNENYLTLQNSHLDSSDLAETDLYLVSADENFIYPALHIKNEKEIFKLITADKQNIKNLLGKEKLEYVRYFRYPFLHRGQIKSKRDSVYNFFKKNGYKIAPVTITSNDWKFNDKFMKAYVAGNTDLMNSIGEKYFEHVKWETKDASDYSLYKMNREVNQVLLIHMNLINAKYLDKILTWYEKQGWEFVNLNTALKDDLYQRRDGYIGTNGIPWLYRAKIRKKFNYNTPVTE